MRVHPDDIADYQKAILEARTKTHHLEYVYRVWNERVKRYVWVKINAVSTQQADGTSYVYAMYSNVTEQKETEQKLRLALAASGLPDYKDEDEKNAYSSLKNEDFCIILISFVGGVKTNEF